MKINAVKHDFFNVNKKVDPFIAGAYARDYNKLEFKILVTKFKDYYKANPRPKQQPFPPRMSFASTLQGQTQPLQDEKPTNETSNGRKQEDNECSSPCGQHSSWSKCYYINPAIRPANVNKNSQVQKIDACIAANPQMAVSVKLIQN